MDLLLIWSISTWKPDFMRNNLSKKPVSVDKHPNNTLVALVIAVACGLSQRTKLPASVRRETVDGYLFSFCVAAFLNTFAP